MLPPIDRYQTILLNDMGTKVWTTCTKSLRGCIRPWGSGFDFF